MLCPVSRISLWFGKKMGVNKKPHKQVVFARSKKRREIAL